MIQAKEVKDFEKYVIKSDGTLFSSFLGKDLSNKKSNGNGYLIAALCKNGKYTNKYIHRLVAEAFIPNPENKPQVNHKDGNKSNNCVENLEWVTRYENDIHKYRVLKKYTPRSKSLLERLRQMSCVPVVDISTNVIYPSLRSAAVLNGLKFSTLCAMLKGRIRNKTNLRYYGSNNTR